MIVHVQGKAQAHKRPEKTLSLHVRLMVDIEVTYNNNKPLNKQNPENPGGGGKFDFQLPQY